MKLIRKIENEDFGDLELFETDNSRMTKYQIWFNGIIIDGAKTLQTATKKFDKASLRNNLT